MKQNFTVRHGLLGNARGPVRHGRGAAQARRKRKAECKGCSIERPGGLTLSSSLQSVLHGTALRPVMFDAQVWSLDRKEIFGDRVGRHR
jgi:hypothetical protein